jgi:hypothetical protein
MFRNVIVAAAAAAVLTLSATAFAQQDHGTADEAKAMLLKAVAALKADKAKTLDLINKGEAGSWTAIYTCFAPMSATAKLLASATLMPSN